MDQYRENRDGSLDCCVAMRALRGREGCSFSRLLKCLDVLALLLVLVLQGAILNYFLINRMEGDGSGWYFWFLADFSIMISMMASIFLARKHHSNCKYRQELQAEPGTESNDDNPIKWYGLMPGSYISWFLYSALLTAKVVLLIRMDIASTIPNEAWYGSQFLTLVIGCVAVVFLLFIDIHQEAPTDSKQRHYVTYILTYTCLELLDAVAFLALLFPSECNQPFQARFETLILSLTCCSFIFPTFGTYKLAKSNFGETAQPLGIKLVYRVVHLLFVNGPFLVIRVYLWTYFNADVSVFLLKNLVYSYIHARSLIPECREWIRQLCILRDSLLREDRSFDGVQTSGSESPIQKDDRTNQTETREKDKSLP